MVNRRIRKWANERKISEQKPNNNSWKFLITLLSVSFYLMRVFGTKGYPMHKIEELIEYCEAKRDGDENGVIDSIADSRIFDANELIKEGMSITDVDEEVLKVIESRTGKWDDKQGKFIKDKSDEARARWYEPDYINNCQYKCKEVL